MTRYLGIDQSYSGFAMVFLDGDTGQHTDYLTSFDPKTYGTGIDRLIAIHEHVVTTLIAEDDVEHICMEGYANGAKFGREVAGELGAVVKFAIRDELWDGYPTIVPPTTLKKFVTGKGNAKKQEMLLSVYKRWNVEFTDDNLADAYSLARIAQAIDTQARGLPEFQREIIESLVPCTEKRN